MSVNVYDLTHNLSKALKNSDEYKRYQKAVDKIKGNEEKEKILLDFRSKQLEMQSLQLIGKEIPQEKLDELEKLTELLNLHPTIKEFLEAEYYLGIILGDIQRIIGEALDLWTPEIKGDK